MDPVQAARISALVLAAAGMLLGIALAFLAWKYASLPAAMAAVALLLGCPAIALVVVLGLPPAAIPTDLLHHSERALTLLRMVRAHVCAAGSYVVVLWFCQLGGLIAARGFVGFYTVLTVAALAGYLPWLSREERQLRTRLETARQRVESVKMAVLWPQE